MSNVVPFHPRASASPTDRAVYTVKEVAHLLGLNLGNTYELVRNGTIPAQQLGRRWVIPRAVFHAWLDAGVSAGAELRQRDGA